MIGRIIPHAAARPNPVGRLAAREGRGAPSESRAIKQAKTRPTTALPSSIPRLPRRNATNPTTPIPLVALSHRRPRPHTPHRPKRMQDLSAPSRDPDADLPCHLVQKGTSRLESDGSWNTRFRGVQIGSKRAAAWADGAGAHALLLLQEDPAPFNEPAACSLSLPVQPPARVPDLYIYLSSRSFSAFYS
jgi:hypothetical protein